MRIGAGGRFRERRWWVLALAALAAVVLVGCSGHTTGASNVTASSAQLNFVGSCGSGEHCSYYVQYRKTGTSAWSKTPTRGPGTGPESNVSLSENVTGLTEGTQYEYQACGNAQTTQPFACVGPDGSTSTTSTFTTVSAVSVTPAPAVGPPTTKVTLAGLGFTAHEAVDVYFDLTDETLVSADGSGSISATVTIPSSAQPGTHWLTGVGRSSGRSASVAFTVRTDWAQFHYGASHTGLNPYENTISASNVSGLDEAFSDPTGDLLQSSPVVAGGVLYLGANGSLDAYPASCASRSGCRPVWTASPGDQVPSTPAVATGTVYVTGSQGVRGNGGPADLEAFSASCGTGGARCSPLWTAVLSDGSGRFASAPTVLGGGVYVSSDTAGSTDDTGSLAAYPASCGTGGASCSPLWTADTAGPINDAPTVAGGVVYVGDDNDVLYAFSASCGTGGASCSPLWTANLSGPVFGSPAVANGLVFAGAGDNVYAFPTGCSGTCSPRWVSGSQSGGGAGAPAPVYDSSPAVAGGVVYAGFHYTNSSTAGGGVDALSAPIGSLLWTGATTPGVEPSSPAVDNGVVYVGDDSGDLYAFGTSCGGATCNPLWTATTGGPIESSPAVANGTVYVGSDDGDLHAYDLTSANAAQAQTAKPDAAQLKPNRSLKEQ